VVACTDDNRIRRKWPDTINTVSGSGSPVVSGDGGLIAAASLRSPRCVVRPMDRNSHRTRRVWPTRRSPARLGSVSEDGRLATTAKLCCPAGIAVHSVDGSLLTAESYNFRIRRMWLDGNIIAVTSNGRFRLCGGGSPAASASLASACGVAVHVDGSYLLADTRENRISFLWADATMGTLVSACIQRRRWYRHGGVVVRPV
jgi:hypothetical protein